MPISDLKDGAGPKGNSIDGFTVELTALAGGDEEKYRAEVDIETFFSPKLTPDGGKFGRQLFALFVAAGIANKPPRNGIKRRHQPADRYSTRGGYNARDKNPESSRYSCGSKGEHIPPR